jgi:hypothetical protein
VAELKTQRNDASVADFLAGVSDERRRADAQAVCALMTEVTGERPAMWGTSIVGFGSYEYRYGSGSTGSWPDVDTNVLRELVRRGFTHMNGRVVTPGS